MLNCGYCNQQFVRRLRLFQHLREEHNAQIRNPVPCGNCNAQCNYTSLTNHIRLHHQDPINADIPPQIPMNIPHDINVFDNDLDHEQNQLENNEIMNPIPLDQEVNQVEPLNAEEIEVVPVDPRAQFRRMMDNLQQECMEKWLKMSNHPEVSISVASTICDFMKEAVESAIQCSAAFTGNQTLQAMKEETELALRPLMSDYRRKQHLQTRGLYIPVEEHVIGYEHYTRATAQGMELKERKRIVAMPSVIGTMKALLKNPTIAESLVMPSDYTNARTICHPFAGSRAQELLEGSILSF